LECNILKFYKGINILF